ncbi:MAG: hypothetical protein GYA56_13960 [Geobacteraceae bacterium]|nr:hypothetical protein [Geobacteraceae bacterium]
MDPVRNRLFLSDLIKMDFPRSVYDEVRELVSLVYADYDFTWIDAVFNDVVRLYNGNYPGYRQCTTPYHDLKHMTDVLLALASLVHGAHAAGVSFRERHVTLSLIAVLLHETGYIQRKDDTLGTGGKYTPVRIERSIQFVEQYFSDNGYDTKDLHMCRDFIRCTDMELKLGDISFVSKGEETLAKMVATAEIIGQIADRTYLEKLLFLFQELSEVEVLGYRTELDLLESTLESYRSARHRLENDLGDVKAYYATHFRKRWEIEYDMYAEAIESNLSYLEHLLENHRHDYRDKLQRGGLLKRLAILEEARND